MSTKRSTSSAVPLWMALTHEHVAFALRFAHRIAALSPPVDLDAVRREAASKAWDAAWSYGTNTRMDSRDRAALERYLDTEYPAPAPDRVKLSDGSVVTRHDDPRHVWGGWWRRCMGRSPVGR